MRIWHCDWCKVSKALLSFLLLPGQSRRLKDELEQLKARAATDVRLQQKLQQDLINLEKARIINLIKLQHKSPSRRDFLLYLFVSDYLFLIDLFILFADLKSSELWSSPSWTQFKQLRIEAWKSQDLTGFEPVTSQYRCDALTNWAMKPLTGSNPVEVLTFSGFYTQLLKLRSWLRWS